MKNKIGWCNATWNPVWGCLNNCEYCYAERINKRFWAKMIEIEIDYHFKKHQSWAWTGDQLRNLHDFIPTWLESQYNKKFPKKPQRIFVGSMSEIYHWELLWTNKVINKIKQYPQHTFQFLTKFPDAYVGWDFPENCWLGITINYARDTFAARDMFQLDKDNIHFLSIEPILQYIPHNFVDFVDWIIIGAETGNRKGKIIPDKRWIGDIVNYCKKNNIPVYLKDSLKKVYPEEIKEFPENMIVGKGG